MYQYFKRQLLIHVDFNLLCFIQLSALVGKIKVIDFKNARWKHEIN